MQRNLLACANAGVALIEQPLPANADAMLEGLQPSVPSCADERFYGLRVLEQVARRWS